MPASGFIRLYVDVSLGRTSLWCVILGNAIDKLPSIGSALARAATSLVVLGLRTVLFHLLPRGAGAVIPIMFPSWKNVGAILRAAGLSLHDQHPP